MIMKKKKLVSVLLTMMALVMLLTACGDKNHSSKSTDSSSTTTKVLQKHSSTSSQPNYKLASSSVKLDSANLTPKQNAALVMFYAGVKNRQRYVQRMNKTDQHLSISLYNITDEKKAGVSGKVPRGAEVVYKVSLANLGTTYYTIAGGRTFISNNHGGFRQPGVTVAEMVRAANQNNAGDAINQLAQNASLNDFCTDGTSAGSRSEGAASNNAATASSMDPQDKARAAMNADPNLDPEFKRRINLSPDDPDYIQPTHDPESWR
ncbi:hypothetical protein [Limosilactobacillus oris]|uniref:hypothetical protein n=1 Tax=Limosilactobacillus oris TaxID=1632 RepID=UPI0018847CDD|nr:hypothetical protein [Limosilactobacillus oris]MBF0600545.1 hypothetical protein [Limosilactobacillus oris]